MNVVKLSAESPAAAQLAAERPGIYALQPGSVALKALKASETFHQHPRPVIDYGRLESLPEAVRAASIAKRDEAVEPMPALQAQIHAEAASLIAWRLEHAEDGLTPEQLPSAPAEPLAA